VRLLHADELSARYVRDILQNTSSSVEQVTIEPDGRWHTQEAQRETDVDGPDLSFVHDEDGVIASADVSIVGAWSTATPNRSTNSIGTPLTAFSRESSSMPPRSATSSKRPAAEVIDLTLSDDEEEEPIQPPPAKRLNTRMDYPFTFD
jgi:E3 SUMO-protein ligase PIAS1